MLTNIQFKICPSHAAIHEDKYMELWCYVLFYAAVKLGLPSRGRTWNGCLREQDAENPKRQDQQDNGGK